MPRGPFLFRSAGKGSKRGRFARHIGSGKMEPRTNPFGGTHKNSRTMRSNSLCAKNGSIQITSTDNFLRLKNLTEGQGSARRIFLRGS